MEKKLKKFKNFQKKISKKNSKKNFKKSHSNIYNISWVGSGVCKWAGWGSLWCVGMGGLVGCRYGSEQPGAYI
jgi:hypothetical protein